MGHSFHTLCWKMGIEAKELQEKTAAAAAVAEGAEQPATDGNGAEGNDDNDNISSPVDRFYSDRLTTFRGGREGSNPVGSYLEEKSLYWLGPSSPLLSGNVGRGRWGSTNMMAQAQHTPPRDNQPPHSR